MHATYACSCAWVLIALINATWLHYRARVVSSSDGGATAVSSGSARDCGTMRKSSARRLDKSVALSSNARRQLPRRARLRVGCNANSNAARCMERVSIHCAALLLLLRSRVVPRHVASSHTHKVTLPVVSTPSAYRGRAQPLDQARRLVAAAWESPSARAAMARARTCASMFARTASSRARAASARRPQSAQAFEWPSQEMATLSLIHI